MTHFYEARTNGFCNLGVMEECAQFCFGCRGHDITECFAFCMQCSIRSGFGRWTIWIRGGIAERKVATCSATPTGDREVGCVAIDVQAHPTGMIPNFCIRMGGCIIQKVNDFVAVSVVAAACSEARVFNATNIVLSIALA